jgi:ricin-type beta-trefoil lectin protein
MKRIVSLLALVLASATAGQAAVTWFFGATPPADKQGPITSAMNAAVNQYNTYSAYNANIRVTYNAGVPTAQAGYQGTIEFGGSINARVAQHEMSHWFGCGTYWDWNNHRSGNTWTGANAVSRVKSYDGASATMNADGAHFWPYGWNYDSEGVFPDRNIGIVGALRADMGLADVTRNPPSSAGVPIGTYRLQNRASGKYLDNMGRTSNGSIVAQYDSSASNNQKWRITLSGGYYKFQCVTGNLYLDTLGNTADGSNVGQWANGGSQNQQWIVMATSGGYYKIVDRATFKALDTAGATANGSNMQQWYSNNSNNQQWRFVP